MQQSQAETQMVIHRLGRAAPVLPRMGELLPAAAGKEPGLDSAKY